jgi:hypothetical protein
MKIFVEASDIGKRDDVAVSFDLDGTDLTILVEKKVRTAIGATETHIIDILYVNVGEVNK